MSNQTGLSAILERAIRVITDPAGFYRDMPKTGGLVDPIIFVVVLAIVTGVIAAILSMLGIGPNAGMGFGPGLAAIIFVPIFAVIGSFIGAAIMFVIWRLMGSQEPFETAYRSVAFASAIYPITTVLSAIPYLGAVISVVWGVFLMYTASIETHQLERKKSQIVFGILGLLLVILNVNGEIASRKMAAHMEGFSEHMQELGKNMSDVQNMTPEQAGEAMGKFLKGLEKGAQPDQSDSK